MRILSLLGVLLALATTATAQVPPVDAPQHVHLGLPAPDPAHELSVLWYRNAHDPNAALVLDAPDAPRTIPGTLVPGPSAGFVYEAHIEGLAPDTAYNYTIGSRTFTLRTAPANLDRPVSIVALGDMGTNARAAATAELIDALAPDLVLHAGDISYAEGDQLAWDTWFNMVEPAASRIPWMPALGNHEVGPAGIGNTPASTEVLYYQQRFSTPGDALWYSFDVAGIHIVALDTFSDRDAPHPDQVTWLDDDLAASRDAAWTIVFLHEPPYSSNRHGSSARVQESFVPLFDQYGVDLVIAGHDHGYERTHPLRAGAVTTTDPLNTTRDSGTVYIVTGGGGQSLYDQYDEPAPEWSAARTALYHVVEVTITGDALVGTVVPTQGDAFRDVFRILAPKPVLPDDAEQPRGTPAGLLAPLAIALAAASARRHAAPRNLLHRHHGRHDLPR